MSFDWKAFLTKQGAHFDGDALTGFSTQPASLSSNAVSILSGHRLIRISGPDRQKFLQGQISTHMLQLQPMQYSTGVACTPKGRMYSSFHIIDDGDSYLLMLKSDIAESSVETLKKYAVFFKVELTNTPEFISLGFSGESIQSILPEIFAGMTLPRKNDVIAINGDGYLHAIAGINQRYGLWLKSEALEKVWSSLIKKLTPASEDFWSLLNIQSVMPEVSSHIIEEYIPQHLNLPSLGSVSFKKGCFTGQEIVTRMQNLGQQKSRCYRLTLPGSEQPTVNTKLFDGNGKPAGEIIQAVTNPFAETIEMLAVVRIEAAEANQIFMTADQAKPLQVHEIPYPIDPKKELQQ
ncbi:YgfZ/GcvT domain-containing protein [Endozoicomonas ascidiicola]|uniref:CAF17-like 4Fe-4S cluster assembly/insertion protein YgfZ n=1 Tax=Endozoicomonas ascidiicola TaxID=1698521 RepID=UPI00083310F1|nr:folate-binding protein YgfZ [Endozoicomonas ascidiicola]